MTEDEGGDQNEDDVQDGGDDGGNPFGHFPEILPLRTQANEYLEVLKEKVIELLRADYVGSASGWYGHPIPFHIRLSDLNLNCIRNHPTNTHPWLTDYRS